MPKYTDLTAITGANLAAGDLAAVVDVSDTTMAASGTNKKTTMADLAAAPAFQVAYTPATSVAMPIYRTGGGWASFPIDSGFATAAADNNGQLSFVPVMFPVATTADRIGIEVVTAGSAGSVHRLGIWANSSGVPGTLLVDAGTVDSTTTGAKELTISQSIAANTLYWAGVAQQGNPTTRAVIRVSFNPGPTLASSFTTYAVNGYGATVTGAFASNPSLNTVFGSGCPRIAIRVT